MAMKVMLCVGYVCRIPLNITPPVRERHSVQFTAIFPCFYIPHTLLISPNHSIVSCLFLWHYTILSSYMYTILSTVFQHYSL